MGAEYSGVRLRMIAALGRTKIHTQIDLGFSEAVIEEPMRATLPVLLEFEPPVVRAYNPEVVVAEKVEAIVKLGTVTTRFKDFFDIFLLSNEKRFQGLPLVRQVRATFDHRGTSLPDELPVGLTDAFGNSPDSQAQWKAFIRRNDAIGAPEEFGRVVRRVRDFVYPVLRVAGQEEGEDLKRWEPEAGWV